jgi:hypothetical protein
MKQREDEVLLVQNEFLSTLFPCEVADTSSFVKCSSRLKEALAAPICAPLSKGLSAVLNFPGNTRIQRD